MCPSSTELTFRRRGVCRALASHTMFFGSSCPPLIGPPPRAAVPMNGDGSEGRVPPFVGTPPGAVVPRKGDGSEGWVPPLVGPPHPGQYCQGTGTGVRAG